MIPDLKPYPAMKDSGVPWLEEVPAHWRMLRSRYLLREVDRRSEDGTEPHLSMSQRLGLVPSSMVETTLKSESYAGGKLCDVGDLVLNRLKAHLGVFARATQHGIVSPDYTVLRPIGDLETRYFEEVLRSPPCRGELRTRAKGIVEGFWRLYTDDFYDIHLPVPSADEQTAIVRFLDHADRRIRRYIHAKQRLIKLLEEQKQAIVHRAVTRGLDPDVRLKPSGVEWLGDVPEHWDVWQVGHLSRVGNGSTPSRGNSAYWSGGHYPWLNSSYANRENVTHADQFVSETALRECHLPIVPAGSILVAITGQGKTRGKATVLRLEATINQHLAYITPRREVVSADYLRLVFHGAYADLRAMSDDSGSTKGALTCADLKHFSVALPPSDEQQRLVAAVHAGTQACSGAIARAESEISLLREYRTRLIADVVTGKIDVREAAARLPDEPEGQEPLDAADEPTDVEDAPADDLDAVPEEAEA